MYFDPRSLLFFGANALLLHCMLMLGSALSPWSIFPVLIGPMLIFPVLYMRHSAYFLCALCTGLWVDAALPVPFGLLTGLFLITGAITFMLRNRFRAEENDHPCLLAHIHLLKSHPNNSCHFSVVIPETLENLKTPTSAL